MTPAKLSLILAPTPLHPLGRIGSRLGLDLWIKRDDLTGFAMGGNKGRKLEYLMAEAIASGAEVVVTCGSLQSNFVRQLGAACSIAGLLCVAAVMGQPYNTPEDRSPVQGLSETGGNVLLDELLGVELRRFEDDTWDSLFEAAEEIAQEFEASGRKVFRIPVGGSSPLGALAFYEAAREIADRTFDWIIVASSSGSTQTGLAYAFDGTGTKVLGIACDPEPEISDDFAALGEGLAALIGARRSLSATDYRLDFRFVGPGYGVPSEAGCAAIELLARTEGIFLDPVYSAKAFAGLLALAKEGGIGGRVLFWHTGGTPALFASLMG